VLPWDQLQWVLALLGPLVLLPQLVARQGQREEQQAPVLRAVPAVQEVLAAQEARAEAEAVEGRPGAYQVRKFDSLLLTACLTPHPMGHALLTGTAFSVVYSAHSRGVSH
jgi:hypothetical protein